MEEKINFIKAWQTGDYTVSELCDAYDISRTTGHKLIKKYKEEGFGCLIEKSRRPNHHPNKTPKGVEKAIISLRNKHKNWGARKLMKLLEREYSQGEIPSETTVNAILKRNGLVKQRRKRSHRIVKVNPKFDPKQCNEIWSADYKGKFRLGNNRYCHPLTICDSRSRYLFSSRGHYNPTYKAVREEFIRVFRAYGMPWYIHTDNGTPFGSAQSIQRFSRLSYWLIEIGIHPLFSDPGSPQQNGRHERMHKDLKAECTNPPATTLTKQQHLMERFVKEYNEVRPHEALGMLTPHSVHEYSKREYPEKIEPYDYPYTYKKMKITASGAMRWGGYHWVYVSTGAKKKYVGVEEIGEGIWKVYYRDVFLGSFDAKQFNRKEQYLKLHF